MAVLLLGAAIALNAGKGETPVFPADAPPIVHPIQISGMDPIAYLIARQKANALIGASSWADAAGLLERLVQAYPYDGQAWRQLGIARMRLGENAKAAAAFVLADRYGLADGADYNAADAARAFALTGDQKAAMNWLQRAMYGYTYRDPVQLLADLTFDGLRTLPEFRAMTGANAEVRSNVHEVQLSADLDYYLEQYTRYRFPKLTPHQISVLRLAASQLRKRLGTLTDDEVVVEFQRLSAAAPGGHNYSTLGRGVGGGPMLSLPIDLYLFPEGLFVIGATDHRYDRLIGGRVTAFGGVSTEDMLDRVAPLIDRDLHADSNVIWHSPQYLSQLAVLHDLGAATATSVKVTVEVSGRQESLAIDGVPYRSSPRLYPSRLSSGPPPLGLERVGDNYWYADIDDHTTYVQFNQVINKQGESLMEFGLRLRKHLEDAGTKNLIVDVRFNGGGNTFEYLELLRTVIAFDAEPGHHLYYVEGRATFSAAVNFTTEVRTLTHAIFVGEPASAPRAAGDPVSITLPNSKIEVRFSTDVWSLYYPDDSRNWIPPDLPVTLTAREYFANQDPVLSTIEALIAKGGGAGVSP